MKRIQLFFTAMLLLAVSNLALAQSGAVSGVVIDQSGQPVQGVTVMVEGTTNGTYTDSEGRYSLTSVAKEATLVYSSIGYTEVKVKVGGRNTLPTVTITEDNQQLAETIVVAFGTATKESFTGAAAVVSAKDLEKHVSTNVANALAGTVPGLQMRGSSGAPGAGAGSINIRGIASLYAGTDPLVIVDGAPYSASLTNIPQSDVESLTVLKDAASAALYGARGAAGVILITTKSGKNNAPQVNVDMKWGINQRGVQDYETIDDPAKYYETVYGAYNSYYFNAQGLDAVAANKKANAQMLSHLGYNIYTVPGGEELIGLNGKINPKATKGRRYEANGETYYLTNDDWRDKAYSNAFRQEYNINVNGSHNRGSYFASIGYLNEDGVIDYSGFERFTARLKSDYQVKKWLKVAANLAYTNSETTSTPNLGTDYSSTNLGYYTARIAPIYPIYVRVIGPDGQPMVRVDDLGNPQYDYGVAATNYPGNARAFLQTGNPFGSNRYNKVVSKGQKFSGTLSADVKFTDFLKFNATSTMDWGHTNASNYQTALYGPKVSVNGEITKSQTDSNRQNHTQTLTYNDKFGRHNITVMLGHEYYDVKNTYLGAAAQGLFSPDIKEINAAAKPLPSNSYTSEYNVEGYFASAQYNFDERYFLSASYRRDASSRFAKENRWGDFWSVGGAWLINKEKFFNAGWVDELKLKASIGQQGNDNIGDNAYIDMYSLSKLNDTRMAASFWRIGNKDITWETTTNLNVGTEFSFWKRRLSGSIDVYTKKTTDLLFWLSIPESAGSRGYYGNVGDIRNTGIELNLSAEVIRTKNVDWGVQFNIAHNKDKVLSLPETKKISGTNGFYESPYWYGVGGGMYQPFIAEYAGTDDKGQAMYWQDKAQYKQDEDGKFYWDTTTPGHARDCKTYDPNEATNYVQKSILPVAFGGFGTTLAVYGFDFSANFDYQIGGKVQDNMYASLMGGIEKAGDVGGAIHKNMAKAWTTNNTSTSIPRFQYGDAYTTYGRCDRWYTNASYLNFQSFTVGYTLPKSLVEKLGVSRLRVYASGENLYFWSARKGLDPRYSYSGNASVNVYSPVRTIMGGVQVSF